MQIDFQNQDGVMVGLDNHNREWRVVKVVTGWRLEFRDDGDELATYAGTHPTVERAMDEASRHPRRQRAAHA
jgi:hypothetical protein